jgi:adenosine kinase
VRGWSAACHAAYRGMPPLRAESRVHARSADAPARQSSPPQSLSSNVARVAPRWGCKLNDAILAEDKHKPLYAKLAKDYPVEYIAGGATQNSIRVAQWMMGAPGSTAFCGAVGPDDVFGKQLEAAAQADGVNVQYYKQGKEATGTCAVLVKGGERSLCANLAAANCYDKAHFDTAPIQKLVAEAKIFYCAGFFLTVSVPTILAIGEHTDKEGKILCMNLSAPFIPQFFKDPLLDQCMKHVDILFGNESEAEIYAESKGWGKDVATCALEISKLPKASGARPRIVVFTQGSDPTRMTRLRRSPHCRG